jgi:hypothetical protein
MDLGSDMKQLPPKITLFCICVAVIMENGTTEDGDLTFSASLTPLFPNASKTGYC